MKNFYYGTNNFVIFFFNLRLFLLNMTYTQIFGNFFGAILSFCKSTLCLQTQWSISVIFTHLINQRIIDSHNTRIRVYLERHCWS